ncbi:hypothetical protein PoB_003496000 [Plakobranchus ocellatus]|uniref:Uncharacterized protein n=1 Tax=Plakobranchus ocellatus TaxID=259542 RepID=A0AAV4AJV7_9GAST|nr:hypothetical protein PoB_003496000 [Plakobranchus ocellatus]
MLTPSILETRARAWGSCRITKQQLCKQPDVPGTSAHAQLEGDQTKVRDVLSLRMLHCFLITGHNNVPGNIPCTIPSSLFCNVPLLEMSGPKRTYLYPF